MSDVDPTSAERLENMADLPNWLLGAGRPAEAARRLKLFSHHCAVLSRPQASEVRKVAAELAATAAALPDDTDLAEWRRFVSRNLHRLERGRIDALMQLALDEGAASAPGRAAQRWLARTGYQGTWFRRIGTPTASVDGCTLVLEGHTDAVFDVVWTPDGKKAISGAADWTLKVWDMDLGSLCRTIATQAYKPSAERRPVRRVAVDPSGHFAVVGDMGGVMSVWIIETGQQMWWDTAHGKDVNDVNVTPDGRIVSVGSPSKDLGDVVVAWDLATGKRLAAAKADGEPLLSLALLPDGRSFFTAGLGGRVTRWDLDGLAPVGSRAGPEGAMAIASVRGGRALAVAGTEALWVIDAETMDVLSTHEIPRSWSPVIAVHPDGYRLLVGRGFDLAMLDLARGEWSPPLHGHGGITTAVAVHPDGTSVLWATQEGTIRRWSLDATPLAAPRPHREEVTAIVVDGARRRVLSTGRDGAILAWDPATGRETARFGKWAGPIVGAALEPGGGRIVVVHEDGVPAIWDLTTDACVARFATRTYGLDRIALGPGGALVATAGGYTVADGPGIGAETSYEIRLWDSRDGALVGVLEGHEAEVTALVFHPGVGLVSAGRDGVIRTWDVDTRRCLRAVHVGPCLVLGVVPGTRSVLAGDAVLQRWDLGEGSLVWERPRAHDRLQAIAVSGDGRAAATIGRDRTLAVWDLERAARTAQWEADVSTRTCALLDDGRIALGDDAGSVTFLEPVRVGQ